MSLPLIHAGRTNPGLSAQLDLRFALDKSLTAYRGPTPSFSRASTGSYFDGSGVLRYANVNTILYSEQLENAYWFKSGLSISADSTVAPDGKTTADKVVENASSGIKYGTIAGGFSVVSGTTYTFSAYAKDSGRYFGFATNSTAFPNSIGAVFNLTNGTISNIQANTTASIQSVGNGWYRCIITGTANASATTNINFGISNDLNQIYPSYSGNGSSGYFLWGFQMETGSTVGTYCPTTSSANSAPRFDHTYNGTSWISRGLLVEEQRTNTIRQSENFAVTGTSWGVNATGGLTITTNSDVAPDGRTTADTIAGAPAPGGAWIRAYPVTVTAGSYTFSVFIKKTVGATVFPLVYCYSTAGEFGVYVNTNTGALVNYVAGVTQKKCTDCGSYWRLEVSGSISTTVNLNAYIYPAATNDMTTFSASLTGSQVCWGAQLEAGSFATSYCPNLTDGSTTRSADVCQITGSDFSSFWNASEGSFAVEYDRLASVTSSYSNGFPHTISLVDSGNLVRQALYGGHSGASPTGEIYLYNSSGRITAGALVSGGIATKISAAYRANDFAASLNGAAANTSLSGTLDTVVQMNIGSYSIANYGLNGHIARLRYFNKRLTDKQLEDLCRPEEQLKLDLKFSENLSLTPVVGPTPSFSRASTGTYFNASGVLTSASINTPRFDHVYSGGQWVSRGLLIEEQRTNGFLRSNEFSNAATWFTSNNLVSTDSTTSPDGTIAFKVTPTTSSSAEKNIFQLATIANSLNTHSIYVKSGTQNFIQLMFTGGDTNYANFNISSGVTGNKSAGVSSSTISDVGNGWYRISVTLTNSGASGFAIFWINSLTDGRAPSTTSTGSIYLFGAQYEIGSFPTSYIGTTTSSVTRSADVCQITGADFSGFYNQSEGSYIAEWDRIFNPASVSNASCILQSFIDGNNNDRYAIFYQSTGTVGERFNVTVGNVEYANIDTGASVSSSIGKMSVAYRANDFATSINGASILTDTSGPVISGADRLAIGKMYSSNWINGHISRIRYYAIRLPNRLLIAKSQ